MGFEYDCAGAIICPIQPPKFGINGQRTKARCIGCPHAAFCTTRNDVMARMDEIRQSVTNETTKEWMAIRYITFLSVTMTTIISVQSPQYITISRRMNLACLLQGCGIMVSRKQSHTTTIRLSSAVGWYIARKRIARTRTPNEMHMKSMCNANASLFDANASLFDANAFQMHSKCSASAFLVFPIHANASKYNANESVVYANALLLHDIKEIYIYNIPIYFISFHI